MCFYVEKISIFLPRLYGIVGITKMVDYSFIRLFRSYGDCTDVIFIPYKTDAKSCDE